MKTVPVLMSYRSKQCWGLLLLFMVFTLTLAACRQNVVPLAQAGETQGGEHTESAGLETLGLGRGSKVAVWLTTGDRQHLLSRERPLKMSAAVDAAADVTIDVDANQTYQEIEGFGAALTDSSAWLLANELNPGERNRVFKTLFWRLNGAGLRAIRLPMGASDFALSSYTYNDLPEGKTDPDQSQFSVAHDEAYILPLVREMARYAGDLTLMATPWSAPAWMKDNGQLPAGSLKPEYYGSYADYFKKFLQAYAAEGVNVDLVTVQNEPLFGPETYPSMLMSASEQADFVKNHLGPTLEGLDVGILAFDHNWDLIDYPLEVLGDSAAKAYVQGSAFHCYGGDVSAQDTVKNAHPDKDIYFTECSGYEGAPNFNENLVYNVQNLIIGATRSWAKTVLLWNLALDENHGPTNGGCEDCRGVITIDRSTGKVTYNEEFYALGHGGKAAGPGAQRIRSTSVYNDLETVAFVDPRGYRSLIALNVNKTPKTFKVREGGRAFVYTLPGESVATFVWDGPSHKSRSVDTVQRIEAEDYSLMSGLRFERQDDDTLVATSSRDGDYLIFKNVTFAEAARSAELRVAAGASGGQIEFREGGVDGQLLGSATISGGPSWKTVVAPLSISPGTFDLYVVFRGGTDVAKLNWFTFSQNEGGDSPPDLERKINRANWQVNASVFNEPYDPPQNAIDGDLGTRWTTGEGQTSGQFFEIDMAQPYLLTGLDLNAGAGSGDYPRGYEVYLSLDGSSWGEPVAKGTGASVTRIAFSPQEARYVRIVQTGNSGSWWSIVELDAYTISDTPPEPEPEPEPNLGTPLDSSDFTASASVFNAPYDPPANAIDGDLGTRWATGQGQTSGQTFELDLSQPYTLTGLELDAGTGSGDYPRRFELYLSTDGQNWGAPVATGTGATITRIPVASQEARYVRIVQTGSAGNWWSIVEATVYGGE